MEEARKLAKKLAAKAPLALKAAKSCINFGIGVDLPQGCMSKNLGFAFATQDQKKGLMFLEKRKAKFTGR